MSWWNTLPLYIDPTFITIGGSELFCFGSAADGSGFAIRYYGLMYIFAFLTNIGLLKRLINRQELKMTYEELEGLATWSIVGIIAGGRLGYVFFYNFDYYLHNLTQIFWPMQGGAFVGISGMSFHGGVIGALLFGALYTYRQKLSFWYVANAVFYVTPCGYSWGRLGNFLNGELYGRPTESPLGMYFPSDPTQLRYPSQLFEMAGEGFLLFGALTLLRMFPATKYAMLPLFLIGYGIARFFVEFFREPDAHLLLNVLGLSRGQMLCFLMILAGIVLWIFMAKTGKIKEISDIDAS